jgi:cytoplasmic iron level regulating protein YaaA (DUF328/UPF0246 family)
VSAAAPVVLLPPSEGKAAGGKGSWDPATGAFAALAEQRRAVADALAKAVTGDDVAKLLGVSGAHFERAIEADRAVIGAPVLAASRRYTGVVHAHLDLPTLPATARRRVVIVSGLLGAVGADDPVPDYRLKMAASLAPFGKLSTWWRPHLAAALDPLVDGRPVLDLLPHEHAAAYQPAARTVIRVRFERANPDGTRTIVGHDAKAAKGLLARHVLTTKGALLDRVTTFAADGWSLDGDATDLHRRTGGIAAFVRRAG